MAVISPRVFMYAPMDDCFIFSLNIEQQQSAYSVANTHAASTVVRSHTTLLTHTHAHHTAHTHMTSHHTTPHTPHTHSHTNSLTHTHITVTAHQHYFCPVLRFLKGAHHEVSSPPGYKLVVRTTTPIPILCHYVMITRHN